MLGAGVSRRPPTSHADTVGWQGRRRRRRRCRRSTRGSSSGRRRNPRRRPDAGGHGAVAGRRQRSAAGQRRQGAVVHLRLLLCRTMSTAVERKADCMSITQCHFTSYGTSGLWRHSERLYSMRGYRTVLLPTVSQSK